MWVLVFMVGIVVWRVWETFHKQGSARGQTTMLWSFYALFALSCVVFGGTVLEFFLVDRPFHPGVAWGGVVLWGAASLIRAIAIRTLGRFWSLHVEIREQHDFVRDGPYQYVRHPAYLSLSWNISRCRWWVTHGGRWPLCSLCTCRSSCSGSSKRGCVGCEVWGSLSRLPAASRGVVAKLGDVGRRVDLC